MARKKSPFQQGKEAFWEGRSEKDNPFVPELSGEEFEQWLLGLRQASSDATREEYSNE